MIFLPSSGIKKYNQSGQALLIVLLTMAVILTVVLSITSRSITDIAVTTYEEEALRAFSAAEAGVESALLNPIPCVDTSTCQTDFPPDPQDLDVTYTALIDDPIEDDGQFKYPTPLIAGDVATFWFVEHDQDGKLTCTGDCFNGDQLNICIGPGSPNPGIEVLVFYDTTPKSVSASNNYADVQVARKVFGPISGSSNSYNINNGQCNQVLGATNTRRAQINVTSDVCSGCGNDLIMAKVRMYYYNVEPGLPVGIWTTGDLPSQGIQISSTGVAGDSTRKVNVFQTYSENPTLFDSAVFSMTDLEKS